ALGWPADAMLRLEAIVPPDLVRMEALAARLKMSRAEAERLRAWAISAPVAPDMSERAFRRLLYEADMGGLNDRLRLALASARDRAEREAQGDKALMEAGGF